MKHFKIMGLLMILSLSQNVYSQTTYEYYVGLKNFTVVPENYSKADLLNYINQIYGSSTLYNSINTSSTTVRRSFVGAKTPLLKRSIYIKSTNTNLANELNVFSIYFEEATKMPKMKLCNTPNDYYTTVSRLDSLTLSSGVKTLQTSSFNADKQLDLIRAKEAWQITKGDSRIKVGIADEYLDINHEDLIDNIDTFFELLSPKSHGTEVVSIAIGKTDNGKGISSIAGHKCKLVYSGWSSVERLLRISRRKGVKAVNASWGSRVNPADLNLAFFKMPIDEIVDSNRVVFVGTAGNGSCWDCGSGSNSSCICSDTSWVYPGSYVKCLNVTSIGYQESPGSSGRYLGNLKQYSWKDVHTNKDGIGNSHMHNSSVDVCAPGNLVCVAVPGGYSIKGGTSYAGPMTAGLCLLVASVNPCLNAYEIMDIIKTTANTSIYNISYNQPFIGMLGTGRIDAYEAVKRTLELGTIFQQNKPATGTGKYPSGTVNPIWVPTKILAGKNVTTGTQGDVIIPNGSNIKYEANIEVELGAGFEDQSGTFEMRHKDSPCY